MCHRYLASFLARNKTWRFWGTFYVLRCVLQELHCELRTWPLFCILMGGTKPSLVDWNHSVVPTPAYSYLGIPFLLGLCNKFDPVWIGVWAIRFWFWKIGAFVVLCLVLEGRRGPPGTGWMLRWWRQYPLPPEILRGNPPACSIPFYTVWQRSFVICSTSYCAGDQASPMACDPCTGWSACPWDTHWKSPFPTWPRQLLAEKGSNSSRGPWVVWMQRRCIKIPFFVDLGKDRSETTWSVGRTCGRIRDERVLPVYTQSMW